MVFHKRCLVICFCVCRQNKEVNLPKTVEKKKRWHTRPISLSLVSITTIVELCSQSILQKSSVVSASGPCVAMYAFCCLWECINHSMENIEAISREISLSFKWFEDAEYCRWLAKTRQYILSWKSFSYNLLWLFHLKQICHFFEPFSSPMNSYTGHFIGNGCWSPLALTCTHQWNWHWCSQSLQLLGWAEDTLAWTRMALC